MEAGLFSFRYTIEHPKPGPGANAVSKVVAWALNCAVTDYYYYGQESNAEWPKVPQIETIRNGAKELEVLPFKHTGKKGRRSACTSN